MNYLQTIQILMGVGKQTKVHWSIHGLVEAATVKMF